MVVINGGASLYKQVNLMEWRVVAVGTSIENHTKHECQRWTLDGCVMCNVGGGEGGAGQHPRAGGGGQPAAAVMVDTSSNNYRDRGGAGTSSH